MTSWPFYQSQSSKEAIVHPTALIFTRAIPEPPLPIENYQKNEFSCHTLNYNFHKMLKINAQPYSA